MKKPLTRIIIIFVILTLQYSCGWKAKANSEESVEEENGITWKYNDLKGSLTVVAEMENGNILAVGSLKNDSFDETLQVILLNKDGKFLNEKRFDTEYTKFIYPNKVVIKTDSNRCRIYYLESYRNLDNENLSEEEQRNKSKELLSDQVLKRIIVSENYISEEKTIYCADIFEDFITKHKVVAASSTSVDISEIDGKLAFVGDFRTETEFAYLPYIAFWDEKELKGKIFHEFDDGVFHDITLTDGGYIIAGRIDTQFDGQFWEKPLRCKVDKNLKMLENKRFDFKLVEYESPDREYIIMDADNENDYTVILNPVEPRSYLTFRKINREDRTEVWSCMRTANYELDVSRWKIIKAKNGDLIIPLQVTEEEYGTKSTRIYVTRLSKDGEILWGQRIIPENAHAITELADGNFIVTGDFGNRDSRTDEDYRYTWIIKVMNQ